MPIAENREERKKRVEKLERILIKKAGSKEIMKGLKKSEEDIKHRRLIPLENVFKELETKYGL